MAANVHRAFLERVGFRRDHGAAARPPHLAIDSLGDKFEHALAFSVLALLGALAYPRMPLPRLGERLSFLGALIEVTQSIPALHRDCDILDWATDTVAIVAALAVIALVRTRRQ